MSGGHPDHRIRPPEWTSKDEMHYINKRIDSLSTTMDNKDRRYNLMWQFYEKRINNIYGFNIAITIIYIFILTLIIFWGEFK